MARIRSRVRGRPIPPANQIAPTIANATVNTNDGISVGTTVATVALTNSPNPASVTYSITGGNTGNDFAINSSTRKYRFSHVAPS